MNKLLAAFLTTALLLGSSWSLNVLADKPEKSGQAQAEKRLPKGLQKKLNRGGELPPGWQKKIQQGQVLPPELRASGEPVSKEIQAAIQQDKAADQVASEVIRIEDKLIRVSKGQGTVLDIIDLADVVTGGKLLTKGVQ